jgi:hypothetical protein
MVGPFELLLAAGAFLLLGGGGAGVWVARLKALAARKAREAMEAEVRRSVPPEVRDLARQLGRPIDGGPAPGAGVGRGDEDALDDR